MVSAKTNDTPNTTFAKPNATLTGKVEHLLLLQQNQQFAEKLEAELAEKTFDILVNASDKQIFEGSMQGNDRLTFLLNRLLKLARNPEGGIRQLSPEVIKNYDPQLFTMCNLMSFGDDKHVISGNAFLNTIGKAVTLELNERTPGNLVTNLRSAKPAFPNVHNPYEIPVN